MSVLTITKDNFENEVMKSDKPVLLDFWASWCAPCRMVSPVIDEISDEVTNAKVGKINVDEQPELASAFKVMSIPHLSGCKGWQGGEFRRGRQTEKRYYRNAQCINKQTRRLMTTVAFLYCVRLRSFFLLMIRMSPRESSTIPSAAKYLNILVTTSRALPIYLAICSWVR